MIGNIQAALLSDRFCRSIDQINLNSTIRKLIAESGPYFESLALPFERRGQSARLMRG
jgi:hypothetical protein